MKKKEHAACAVEDLERVLADLQSPEETVRGRAVGSLCPCHAGWQGFEQHMDVVARLKKDPSPSVRARALHVFADAAEMQSSGHPTNPREATNEMLRTKRASRFRPDEEKESTGRAKPRRRRDDAGRRVPGPLP